MPTRSKQLPPSFSPRRRWRIGFDILLRTALVLAVVVMVNYLGAGLFRRFYLSSQTRVELSPRTLSVLHSLTNRITVTLYYDRDDDFYPAIIGLLEEYRSADPRISVKVVDYNRDAGAAQKVKEQYKLNSADAKNLIIFDSGGHVKIAPGKALTQFGPDGRLTADKKLEFRPIAFNGEVMFTSMLLAVSNPKPLKAYFLQGHGEPALDDSGNFGYLTFGAILAQNYIATEPLNLLGDKVVPDDCNLLIIAGPQEALSEMELKKIDDYLAQGGRLFALFDFRSRDLRTGLESILANWGVQVVPDEVKDPDNTPSPSGSDIKVMKFSQHPVVNPLNNLALQMILPRPVGRLNVKNPPADAPKVQVDELAFSGPDSTLAGEPATAPCSYPLMVAVEQKPVAGVVNPRGNTRLVVVGDTFFLGNYYINGADNRDFLGYAVNWLLDRTTLLDGIGPRKVTEFRLTMTHAQQKDVRWLLLGALPGAILLVGGLVWLVRRK